MITGYYRIDEKMITFETLRDVSNYSLTSRLTSLVKLGGILYSSKRWAFRICNSILAKINTELPKISSHPTYRIIQPRKGKRYMQAKKV